MNKADLLEKTGLDEETLAIAIEDLGGNSDDPQVSENIAIQVLQQYSPNEQLAIGPSELPPVNFPGETDLDIPQLYWSEVSRTVKSLAQADLREALESLGVGKMTRTQRLKTLQNLASK